MDIIKIIGVGLISLIIIIIVRQYKPEFTLYVSLLAGALILIFIMDKIGGIVDLLTSLANKTAINNQFLLLLIKIIIVSMSIPIISSLLETVIEILP